MRRFCKHNHMKKRERREAEHLEREYEEARLLDPTEETRGAKIHTMDRTPNLEQTVCSN
jgi:hypothetical protein